MFWKRKSKEPEEFSFQTLTDEEKGNILRCLKDEFKELVETGGKLEEIVKDLQWVHVQSGDTLCCTYKFEYNIPMLRCMIRGLRCGKGIDGES